MEKVEMTLLLLLLGAGALFAQRVETVPFGDFEQWTIREVRESDVVGGEVKTLYDVGPRGKTPWASSNTVAKLAGVTKTSLSAEPDEGPTGRCARLSTVFASCKVAGLVDIQVLASGSLYWGRMLEPVTGVKNPYSYMDWGIPFTERPSALLLDYKALLPATGTLTRGTTFRQTEFPGEDPCQVMLLLQYRWEDEDGNIHAKRVGTAFYRISRSCGWVKDCRIPVIYGDARQSPQYRSYMDLLSGNKTLYALNGKGKRTRILEEGWADADSPVTHAVLHIASGSRGAFEGEIGNTLWVDNVRLEYGR